MLFASSIRYNECVKESTKQETRRSDCPITFGLDLFGDKWTLLILRDLLFFKETRFSDFAAYEGIASNVLADRLKRLEKAGVVTKERDPNLQNQNIYRITDKGRNLLPILVEMMAWGLRYDTQTPASKAFVHRLTKERKLIVKEVTQAIENGAFEDYRGKEMGIDPSIYT